MAITARGLTEIESLGLSLIAGAQGADRDIAWAHAIELPDPTPYLAGGELVMTTGINIGTDAAAQFDYVTRLAAAGSAALAVDTGTRFAEVPPGVLAAGDQTGIPVLAVPASTPFIAIARVVIDALKADELRSVQRVVDQQEVLARATLRGGIPGVVSALADCLPAAVVAVGVDGRVLAAGGAGRERLIDMLTEGADAPVGRRQGGYVTNDGDAFVTVQKLRAAQAVRGQLAVRTAQPLSSPDRLLVAHAVSLISIALEKPARVIDVEQRLRGAVTRDMLLGSGTVDDGVLRYFGLDPHGDVVVALLRGMGPVLAAEQELGRLLSPTGPYLLTPIDDEIVVVLPADGSRHRLLGVTAELGPAAGGASLPVRVDDVAVGLAQARVAAQSRSGGVTDFGALGALGVLIGGRSRAELRLLAAPLDPLRDSAELITTLEAFLRRNGQIEAAAAELGVHRHTMRNRMRRVQDLLGDDLESADSRAQLWLAVKAWQVLASQA